MAPNVLLLLRGLFKKTEEMCGEKEKKKMTWPLLSKHFTYVWHLVTFNEGMKKVMKSLSGLTLIPKDTFLANNWRILRLEFMSTLPSNISILEF